MVQLVSLLFKRYFTDGHNVGDLQILLQAAGDVGLDVIEVEKYLRGDQHRKEVVQQTAAARKRGING